MNIGFVTGEYPPMRGGVGDYTRALGQALIASGHAVYVLADRRGTGDRTTEITVDPLIRRWDVFSLRALRRWAIRNRLAVVNVQFETAAYASLLPIHFWPLALTDLPITTITTYHDLIPPYIFRYAGRLRLPVLWHMGRLSRGCITTNPGDTSRLRAALPDHPVAEIPIGSNIPTQTPPGFDRSAWRSAHQIASETFLIGYFGFINPTKGLETLIDSLSALIAEGVSAELIMIGGGATESDSAQAAYIEQIKLRMASAGLADRVHWTGFLGAPVISAWLTACDLIALPFSDGVSLRRGSFMAALAHGCPILTTAPIDPIPDLDKAAYLIPIGDQRALIDGLRTLSADPDRRAQLGDQARRFARQFTWEAIAAQTIAFYTQVK